MFKSTILTLAAIFFVAANVSFAQVYNNTPSNSIATNIAMDMLKVATISQVHSGTDTLHLAWHKISVSQPTAWEIALCDYAHCYTTLPDSGIMDPILPGDAGLMSLHITPHINTGVAVVRYALWDINDIVHIDTLTWVVTCANAATEILFVNSPKIYSYNKTIFIDNTSSFYTKVVVCDITGRVIIYQPLSPDRQKMDLQFIKDGIYTTILSGQNGTKEQKIILTNQ